MKPHPQLLHKTAMSLCLALMVTVLLVATTCTAKHHHDGQTDLGEGGDRGGKTRGGGGARDVAEEREDGGRRDKDDGVFRTRKSRTDQRNVLLHEAVRKLLGFESSPSPPRRQRERGLLVDPRKPPPMPKYVLDLYDKYRSGELHDGHSLGNTVRSIPAEIGEVNGESMFIFNLSSIATTERVLRAHVHLFKRKSVPRKKIRSRMRADTELVLYEVAPHYLSQTGSIIMRSSARGWQWYGATDAVLSCLLVDREHPHLFALSFRAEKPNGKSRPLALRRFVKHHSRPFLILYSNETESVNLEELDIVAERLKQRGDHADPPSYDDDDDSDGEDEEENVDFNVENEEGEEDDAVDSGDVDGDDGELSESDASDYEDKRRTISKKKRRMEKKRVVDIFRGFGRKNSQRKRNKSKRKKHGHHKKHSNKTKSKKLDTDENLTDIDVRDEDSSERIDTKDNPPITDKNELESNNVDEPDDEDDDESNEVTEDAGVQDSKDRAKRSILTNEIPEDPVDLPKYHYRFNLPQTHPGMLTARRESRRRMDASRIIPYPAERSSKKKKAQRRRRKHRKRKNRRRKGKGGRRLLVPEQWEDYRDNMATRDHSLGQVCARRRLVVDFADIGWGDWIISPKSFEAHYCAGTCPFPLTKRLRPSNHATIQSIVHAIGLYSNVPAPCCVPDAMTSVTLLYFDENRNVVLKNYPGMSVQSCACR